MLLQWRFEQNADKINEDYKFEAVRSKRQDQKLYWHFN